MENTSNPYRSFRDLQVYRAARRFRREMYQVANNLPDKEKYNLGNQIRSAALSLSNNIAEGHGRFDYLDNIRFVLISRGSLTELYDDLNVCKDEQYLDKGQLTRLKTAADDVMRRLHPLSQKTKSRRTSRCAR